MSRSFESDKQFAEYIDLMCGKLWIVGGAVRDELMGREPHDRDYVVTGINAEDMPFDKVVGDNFPVFLVEIDGEKCEVALARKEKKDGQGHKGFTFYTDKHVTIRDDLSRRDLTINAIAKDVLRDNIIVDPFMGYQDIENRILRHTTDAFAEDPLRVYRVARFAAQLGFDIDFRTLSLMHDMESELHTITPERVWIETEKVLNTPNPRRFFEVLKSIGVLHIHFKELANLNVPDKHDGTAFNHTMNVLNFGTTPIFRFGILTHDFGKGLTFHDGHPAHHGHERMGKFPTQDFCDRLKVPNKYRNFGVFCATNHMRVKTIEMMRRGKLLRWILNNKNSIKDLIQMSFLDSTHREDADYFKAILWAMNANIIVDQALIVEKNITGQQLLDEGYEAGPTLGNVLFQRRVDAFKNSLDEVFE